MNTKKNCLVNQFKSPRSNPTIERNCLEAQAGEEVSPEELKQKTEELQNEAINLFKDLYKDGGESSGSSEQPKN